MTTDNEHAARLLAAIVGGDEQAMAAFYAAFGRQVSAFAQPQLREPQEAEDVVVETMYEVWRAAGTLRPCAWNSAPQGATVDASPGEKFA